MDRVDYESVIIQDILSSFDRDELNISPWYQRRAVWKRPQKSYLINTILECKPVPTLYVRHMIDLDTEKTIREVVDGQQRVRCLLEYKAGEFSARHPHHKKPVRYDQLTKKERVAFLQTGLSIGYLIGATDSDVIEIFARINSVAKTLNPQEKRNAQYSGAFKQFCLKESVERLPFWRENAIFTDNDIARMVEVQFVSDLVMNLLEGLQDFSAQRLNKYYEHHDEDFPQEGTVKKRLDALFSTLLTLPTGSLKGTVFARPQVLFSLLLVLDQLDYCPKPSGLRGCIDDLDARIAAMRSGDNQEALPTEVYEAFTSGNMHRIRYRKARQKKMKSYF